MVSSDGRRSRTPLHQQILFGLVAGALAGVLANALWRDAPPLLWLVDHVAQPVGQVFLRMLFMVVVPLVFTSLALGVAALGDLSKVGRIGAKTLVFSETTAAEVMTPRTQIVAVPASASWEAIEAAIVSSGHSRIPVYEGSIDHIIGVILARDFWRARRQQSGEAVRELVRPVPFVPESKDLEHLLREMQSKGVHIVIVLDEYGGTAGLVMVEDLIEEIVGEIQDEHEPAHRAIEEVEPRRFRIAGRALVADLNEQLELELPAEEYTTVAGYMMGQLGRIARPGDAVEFRGGRLEVLRMAGSRIEALALSLDREPARETVESG